MDTAPSLRTRPSLLARIRLHNDNADWAEFLDLYYAMITGWCRSRNFAAQEADLQDLVQDVLVKLFQAMKTFQYDRATGRFRGWLRKVTECVCNDVWRERRSCREVCATDGEPSDPLGTAEAREDLEARLAKAFDLELLQIAQSRVRLRVTPKNWEAFQLRTTAGLSPDEVAEKLGIPRREVDVAKCRVIKMVREEVEKLQRLRDDDLVSDPATD